MYSVADQVVDILEQSGIKRIYGIVGDSLNPITDALRRKKTIEWIHVRHEEVAAFAASAEAQLTGSLAVCCGSSGPGNLHLINGLFDAHRSHARVLAIASHIPQSQVGVDYFQATHPEELFRECSVYSELASEPEQVPRVLLSAIQHAYARQDVGVIVLPGDVAASKAEGRELVHPPAFSNPRLVPADSEIKALAELVNASEKITFFCGIGCAGSEHKIAVLAQKLKAPVAYTWRGKEIFEYDNPNGVGMTGLLGWGDAYEAMKRCDLLVMWGTDFPYQNFIPTNVKVVQIDIRGEYLGRRCRLDLGICGDAGSTADALAPLVHTKDNGIHLTESLKRHGHQIKKMNAYIEPDSEKPPIRPEHLTTALNALADNDAVFTIDTGTPCIWAARYICATKGRNLIGSFSHGSMADAMPMAIGAQAAFPGRQVIALCGDGGFSMLAGDLITVAQYKLPIKLVVYNNDCLDFIQLEMEAAGLVPSQIDLHNPSFADLARAVGIRGFRLEKPCDIERLVKEFLDYPGPALLDAVVDRNAISLPPYISIGQAASFSLSMVKQTLNGEVGQVWDTLAGNRKLF
ncbi:thiamine pyrophosphate-binding protein [Akkermansia sp. N21116]|uniref:thiamine pyrophosphate-dependent enzyme n=1 Tax=Akkermansia sp. N21116 TaxID=3040764 RepID=UPI00244EB298|nr:thiamine pyrophosphate-dependent enzyme [Akkermansia sp. N21116]WPX40530.1 thiamine pyrophosphate-binding protein [Akkermansia sp. N21116]